MNILRSENPMSKKSFHCLQRVISIIILSSCYKLKKSMTEVLKDKIKNIASKNFSKKQDKFQDRHRKRQMIEPPFMSEWPCSPRAFIRGERFALPSPRVYIKREISGIFPSPRAFIHGESYIQRLASCFARCFALPSPTAYTGGEPWNFSKSQSL